MSERDALLDLVRQTQARVEWLRDSGLEFVETAPLRTPSDASPVSLAPPEGEPGPGAGEGEPSLLVGPNQRGQESRHVEPTVDATTDLLLDPAIRSATSLPALRSAIGDCQGCKLAPHRTNLVFGVGNPEADLVFVGEAPGHDEDVRGEPFVGRAGQLLTDIIVKGMKLRREDVYIANIIKCRPPQNRNPEADEIASCEPFLVRQLAIIQPRAIVALGTFAAQALLRTRTSITRLRGTWADYHGIPLMPTFHPAYLLRSPSEKRKVWEDIQQVMHLLGIGA